MVFFFSFYFLKIGANLYIKKIGKIKFQSARPYHQADFLHSFFDRKVFTPRFAIKSRNLPNSCPSRVMPKNVFFPMHFKWSEVLKRISSRPVRSIQPISFVLFLTEMYLCLDLPSSLESCLTYAFLELCSKMTLFWRFFMWFQLARPYYQADFFVSSFIWKVFMPRLAIKSWNLRYSCRSWIMLKNDPFFEWWKWLKSKIYNKSLIYCRISTKLVSFEAD